MLGEKGYSKLGGQGLSPAMLKSITSLGTWWNRALSPDLLFSSMSCTARKEATLHPDKKWRLEDRYEVPGKPFAPGDIARHCPPLNPSGTPCPTENPTHPFTIPVTVLGLLDFHVQEMLSPERGRHPAAENGYIQLKVILVEQEANKPSKNEHETFGLLIITGGPGTVYEKTCSPSSWPR